MSECLSFSRILEYTRGEGQLSTSEADHLSHCQECEHRQKLASDDTLLEQELREAEQQASRFPLRTTEQIGDYEVVREIGRGGMGVVYEAVQQRLDRRVALKVLPALLHSLRPESGARFKAEAAAAARLQHPNIVPIYDYGEYEGCHYYAMELIRGNPLGEIIKQHQLAEDGGEVKPAARDKKYYLLVARWMAEVADALQFAHDQGVIHRDIKPNNLILCESGRVMVSDFGLAKDMNQEAVTRSGQLMGTWRYMSPEQVRQGGEKLDHRTDIYSLGATMYELLTLQPAIVDEGGHEVLAKVLEHEPIPPRKLVRQIPIDLEIICLKALAKNAGARYASAAEIGRDLRRFLEDQPIHARRPQLHRRLIRHVRRHRFTVALGLVAVLLTTSVVSTAAYLELARERSELRNTAIAHLVTKAKGHLDAGRYNMAASVYSNVLKLDSSLAYAYASRALVYSELGRYDEAIDDLTSAITLSPRHSGPYFRRGVLHLIQGAHPAAMADFERAGSLNPNDEQVRLFQLFGRQQAADGGPQDARELLLAGRTQSSAGGYLELLVDYLSAGGDPKAVLEAAAEPQARMLVFLALAEDAMPRGQVDKARSWYAQGLSTDGRPGVIRQFCLERLERCGDR